MIKTKRFSPTLIVQRVQKSGYLNIDERTLFRI